MLGGSFMAAYDVSKYVFNDSTHRCIEPSNLYTFAMSNYYWWTGIKA